MYVYMYCIVLYSLCNYEYVAPTPPFPSPPGSTRTKKNPPSMYDTDKHDLDRSGTPKLPNRQANAKGRDDWEGGGGGGGG